MIYGSATAPRAQATPSPVAEAPVIREPLHAPVAHLVRSGVIEGVHHGSVAVLTADGATLLWSSNHCLATAGTEVRVMQPKEIFNYGTKWAGSTSKPGCGAHTRLGPGDYLLVAKLAGKASSPVVFRLEY